MSGGRPGGRRAGLLGLVLLITSPLSAGEGRPAARAIGERLFLETRFAQYFAAHFDGDVNRPLPAGDPVMDVTVTTGAPLPGPFAGQAMNCRACHLLDEQKQHAGNRTFTDFARRSPLPAREDGRTVTPRNSPSLVGASAARRGGLLLHFDGEFASLEALVEATFTGRNLGWLADEPGRAVAHVATVLREDDGTGDLARRFGGAYRLVLAGDPSVPEAFRLPKRHRVDVDRASDAELLAVVARLVGEYLRSLAFATDARGAHVGSPYDVFLRRNRLPRKPRAGESARAYTRRLRAGVERLRRPRFVAGVFRLHAEPFVFGPGELAGLRLFLGSANCASCHPPPEFSDFGFHNTGVSELEYDAIHGAGAFGALEVPDLPTRDADPVAFLPPSAQHPRATGRFRAAPSAARPGETDLGLWNVYGNSDVVTPRQQRRLDRMLCRLAGRMARGCPPRSRLDDALGRFKTPGLRGLVDAAPYLHTGAADTLEGVLGFYAEAGSRARRGTIRNPDPELPRVQVNRNAIAPLAAFLRALTEDYEDAHP